MSTLRSYRYRIVDVFTQVPLEGNALAVFTRTDGLDGSTMQRIARELNLSETVFVQDAVLPGCAKKLRIFTPYREMLFAGHPTIGASYVLADEGLVPGGEGRFTLEEQIGPVEIRIESGLRPMIWLETPSIRIEREFERAVCASILRLDVSELLNMKPQLSSAGNPTLLIALQSKESVDRASLDEAALRKLRNGVSNPICVFAFAPTAEGAYSRMFAPEYGIIEDPATGSSTGPLAAFMRQHDLLPNGGIGRFVSEQGTKMGRRSFLYFEWTAGSERDRISVGGHVTPLVEATMTL